MILVLIQTRAIHGDHSNKPSCPFTTDLYSTGLILWITRACLGSASVRCLLSNVGSSGGTSHLAGMRIKVYLPPYQVGVQ